MWCQILDPTEYLSFKKTVCVKPLRLVFLQHDSTESLISCLMRWKDTEQGTCENLRVLFSGESLQTFQCPTSCLQLTLQVFSGWLSQGKSKSGWNDFLHGFGCVFFGYISCWKIQAEPARNFLAETICFSIKISWYFMESLMLFILSEEERPWNTTQPPPSSQRGFGSSL